MKDLFPSHYRILSHVLFWIAVFGLFLFTAIIKGGNLESTIVLNLALLPVDMAGAYFTIYFLIPRYLFTKKYYIFFPAVILFTLAYGVLVVTPAEYFIITKYYGADKWGGPWAFLPGRLLWTLVILLMINGLAASAKITKRWIWSQRRQYELENEKIQTELKLKEAELKFLKAQIHPHFLFNTLNNLYGLTLEKSDQAPEVVVKLSEMLDYMLYECNQELVPLVSEVKLLENYIGLEQIRYDKHLRLEFKKGQNLGRYEIAPLLLLAFIENAFKHGSSDHSEEVYIRIKLEVIEQRVEYVVENSIESTDNNEINEGLGLKNLRKRLELIYNDRYEIILEKEKQRFIARLHIELDI